MLPKICIKSNKVSNKSCSKLNFVEKSRLADISMKPRNGARDLERLIWLKYYFVLKWQNIFNLELNTAKSMHHIKKKGSNKSCSELNFVQKSQ